VKEKNENAEFLRKITNFATDERLQRNSKTVCGQARLQYPASIRRA
jgi:hypothetical protein